MDLLNRILVPNEDERITIPEIEQHPWYTKALSADFTAAEAAITLEQQQLDAVQKHCRISMVRSPITTDICTKAGRERIDKLLGVCTSHGPSIYLISQW